MQSLLQLESQRWKNGMSLLLKFSNKSDCKKNFQKIIIAWSEFVPNVYESKKKSGRSMCKW